MSRFCISCGKELSLSAKFCSGCGTPVLDAEVVVEEAEASDSFACPSCGETVPRGQEQCPHCDSQVAKSCHACQQSIDPDLECCPHCSTSIYKPCIHCGAKVMHNSNYCKQCQGWQRPQKAETQEPDEVQSLRGCMSIVVWCEIVLLSWLVGYMKDWSDWKTIGVGILISVVYSMSSTMRGLINFGCSFVWAFVVMNWSPVLFGKESEAQFFLRMLMEKWAWEYWYMGVLTFLLSMFLHLLTKKD